MENRIRSKRILQATAFVSLAVASGAYGLNSNIDSRCGAIANVNWPGITITAAQSIPARTFTPPGSKQTLSSLPAFCRVAAVLKPTPDSNIKIELWMPEKDWNGRFLGTGNGGGAGKIRYNFLADGIRRGYATANTDHEMTVTSKKILTRYYRKAQSRSYFVGCSTGGQQALMEAQRYPTDYNGIVAGAPANNRTHLHTGFIWNYKATNLIPGSALLPTAKIALVTNAVVAACAGKDGGSPNDNFLTDPRSCKFDPDTIPKCQGADNASCLTSAQVVALKKIYAGPTNPSTGERIYTPLPFGSENSGLGLAYQQDPAGFPEQFYPYRWAFGINFDYRKFDFNHDQDLVDAKLARILNANNPDLSGLEKRGGKLLMYTGTADPLVPFQDTLNYYERVVQDQRKNLTEPGLAQTQDFFRYFLVPGMGHCGGGPGLNTIDGIPAAGVPDDSRHDVLAALVKWVEDGTAPDEIIATGFVDGDAAKGIRFQRPVCPYPKFPDYVGGDWKLPSSYRCVDHPRDEVLAPAKRYLN